MMRSESSWGVWFSPERCQPGTARPLGEIAPLWPKDRPSMIYEAWAEALKSSHASEAGDSRAIMRSEKVRV